MKYLVSFFLTVSLFIFASNSYANSVSYTLDTGDKVRVTVFQEKDLSGEFEVSAEGELSIPLIGSVGAKGRTLKEVEQTIVDKLLDGFLKSPRVSLEVLNYRPFYILGEVNAPGSYPYVNGMTALNAVALGGGYTYRADQDDLYLIRATDDTKIPVKIKPETKVLPGDVVRVEERLF